jgi:cyclic-di-GMP-binding protein
MPSFDIVSKIDPQVVDNAINSAIRELATRYDFKDSKSTIELDKKQMVINLYTGTEMQMDGLEKIIIGRFVKQNLDPRSLDFGKDRYASGNMMRKDVKLKQGIEKEASKKIVKAIKESGLKVQASIMDDLIRVTGKKLDDLQDVIALCRSSDFEIPLQYINMKG